MRWFYFIFVSTLLLPSTFAFSSKEKKNTITKFQSTVTQWFSVGQCQTVLGQVETDLTNGMNVQNLTKAFTSHLLGVLTQSQYSTLSGIGVKMAVYGGKISDLITAACNSLMEVFGTFLTNSVKMNASDKAKNVKIAKTHTKFYKNLVKLITQKNVNQIFLSMMGKIDAKTWKAFITNAKNIYHSELYPDIIPK